MKRSLFALLALSIAGLFAGCDSSSSSPTSPAPAASSSPVGIWSTSDASTTTVLTIGQDGSYTKVVGTTIAGTKSYNRMSGTWTASGSALNVTLTKSEASTDGTNWMGANLASPIATAGTFQVNGTILSITIAGVETRYVQGTSGVVPAETVEAPVITPNGGSYTTAQTVAITSVNAGAEIHYTLDGSTPSSSSPLYSAAIQVTATTTVKAVAVKNGTTGPVASATFTIQGGSNPGSSSLVGSWVNVDAGVTTTLTFAADGSMTSLLLDPSAPSQYRYDRASLTWTAVGSKLTTRTTKEENSADMVTWTPAADFTAQTDSATFVVSGSSLTITFGTESIVYTKTGTTPTTTVSAPIITPNGGSYSSAQSVAIVSATAGASVYYTVDGTTPTKNSLQSSTGLVTVSVSETIKAIAILNGTSSSVSSATFTIQSSSTTVSAPIITPNGGSYSSAQSVAIVSTTAGASVYYTEDGTTPTKNSLQSSTGIVVVSSSETIKAIAILNGTSSAVSSATFTIQQSTSTVPAALIGTWSATDGSFVETDKFNADGSFTLTDYDPSGTSGFNYLRITGTFTVTGTTLKRAYSKFETSNDGTVWTNLGASTETSTDTWAVSGSTLRLTDSTGTYEELTKK